MTRTGDSIEHPVTGERITFLETSEETGGEYATFELRVRPHGFVAAPHVHPYAEESFEVQSGTFTFVLDGRERTIGPGRGATVPAGKTHAWWNAGEDEGVAIVEFRPGWKTEEFFESFFGTPQGLNFEHAAAMFGLEYENPQTVPEFVEAYRKACVGSGPGLIEVKTDREENVALHRELLQGISSRLPN